MMLIRTMRIVLRSWIIMFSIEMMMRRRRVDKL